MQIGSLGTKGTATLGGTSQIQKTEKKTVENAITDGFVKQIQTLAREDAEKGIYMDEKFSQLRRARMEQYVSPNRAGPMAKVNSVMKTLEKEQERIKVYLEHLFGDYSAEIEGDSTFRTAEVYSPEGELIASYSSFYGQWTTHQTKAEFNFITETDMIYLQAFREARAEMKVAAQGQAPTDATTVDIRA